MNEEYIQVKKSDVDLILSHIKQAIADPKTKGNSSIFFHNVNGINVLYVLKVITPEEAEFLLDALEASVMNMGEIV